METFAALVEKIDGWLWGYFLMFLLVGTGIFLTFRMRFVQIRMFKHAWSLVSGKWDDPNDEGETTHFQALTTALSATVGVGNIAGVATAIAAGGPGAVFWMWVTAFVGMCTKFTCCSLAMFFRKIDEKGEVSGGPMYYLKYGMNKPVLAVMFAIFTTIASFGIGNLVQANSTAVPIVHYTGFSSLIVGIIIAVFAGIVLLGGVKRIAMMAEKVVPFMAVIYIVGGLTILGLHYEKIPAAFMQIILGAFGLEQVGGGVAGYGIAVAMRFGIARGLFSNESGLGSAPIAHATAKTKEPLREGLVALLEPFIDTLMICTMTGLVVVISGLYNTGVSGSELTMRAFEAGLPGYGKHIVSLGLILFAFTTIVGWSYYGDRSVKFLFKGSDRAVKVYRWIYVLLIPVGAASSLPLIWNLSDIANGLMALPNLIALIGMSGYVANKLKDYEVRLPTMKTYK